jgi:hypothetical protein
VEALNGALKRRLLPHLLMRGSRGFESATAYVPIGSFCVRLACASWRLPEIHLHGSHGMCS